ncbi:MAG: aminoacyl-tRNA hydrolase [Melioribacteraceae bacterium]|nr:aminoacyl-tRNA hydrolase [Melioribacteraceae bacterium]MCF8264039.1 aminoacyl-tRNA hydrolase [Melioribacteraceae bacterium]MCF8411851.1 aminoacyl-tRNA hydrolase [Melioribacteraceae bacterium]
MRAVLGIGNPGLKYENTRHNLGFIILDKFAEKHQISFKASKFDCFFGSGSLDAASFGLIKPTTYVNNSGLCAKDITERYGIEIPDLLVITDDINLPSGRIRIRKSGGTGGHNGIESIIYHLQSENFPRLRFGIGSDFSKGKMAAYVLDRISDDEFTEIKKPIDYSVELIENFIRGGSSAMLNHFAATNNKLNEEPNQKGT